MSTAYPIRSGRLQWNTHGTFFMSRCLIVSLPVPAFRPNTFLNSDAFGSTFIEPGQSCTQLRGFDTLSDGSTVVRKVRDANPDYKISWSNELSFKAIKLYFLLDHQRGGTMADLTQFEQDVSLTSPDYDTPTKPGKLTGAQRLALFGRTVRPWMYDITYLKLREATLTVDLPQRLVQKVWNGARFVSLSLSGRNLLTFTGYPVEPEVVQEARSAPQEVPWDIWAYPPSRSFWASINVGF